MIFFFLEKQGGGGGGGVFFFFFGGGGGGGGGGVNFCSVLQIYSYMFWCVMIKQQQQIHKFNNWLGVLVIELG